MDILRRAVGEFLKRHYGTYMTYGTYRSYGDTFQSHYLVVLDSAGIGAMPDAPAWGDAAQTRCHLRIAPVEFAESAGTGSG